MIEEMASLIAWTMYPADMSSDKMREHAIQKITPILEHHVADLLDKEAEACAVECDVEAREAVKRSRSDNPVHERSGTASHCARKIRARIEARR